MKTNQNSAASSGYLDRIVWHIWMLPIWIITLCFKPWLPETHPWKHQRMTLKSWVEKGTKEAYCISFTFWWMGGCLAAVGVITWAR